MRGDPNCADTAAGKQPGRRRTRCVNSARGKCVRGAAQRATSLIRARVRVYPALGYNNEKQASETRDARVFCARGACLGYALSQDPRVSSAHDMRRFSISIMRMF